MKSPECPFPHNNQKNIREQADVLPKLRDIFTEITLSFRDKISHVTPEENPEISNIPDIETQRYVKEKLLLDRDFVNLFRSTKTTSLPRFSDSLFFLRHVNESDDEDRISFFSKVPIGEYGEKISRAIILAEAVVGQTFYEKMKDDCEKIDKDNTGMLHKGNVYFRKTVKTSLEGIRTIGESLDLLIAQKVPGYGHDPIALLRDIISGDALNQLALHAPFALVNPMALYGVHFEHALESSAEGGVRLRAETKKLLENEKKLAKNDQWFLEENPSATHRGCPVALKGTKTPAGKIRESGITIMSDILLPYIEYFYHRLPADSNV